MSPDDLGHWKERLYADLRATEEATREAEHSAGVVTLDQSSVGRVSRMDALAQQALALGHLSRLRLRQRQLQAALGRIHAGTYGLCCQCDAALNIARLQTDPAAVFCTACAAQKNEPPPAVQQGSMSGSSNPPLRRHEPLPPQP